MLNSIIIMGRLVKTPDLRKTQSGTSVTSFTVAVERDYQTGGSERQTDFIDCVAWRGTAEFVTKYFARGQMIVVKGRLESRDWTDKDDNKRRAWEVVAESVYFGEAKRVETGAATPTESPSANPFQELADEDGELPF